MVFLLAVQLVALRAGVGGAIVAAFLSFLAINFFFIEPRWTFAVVRRQTSYPCWRSWSQR